MDRGTFRDPRVGAISTNFVMLKADLTRSNTPAVQELSRQFQIAGVPTFVFLAANGRELTPLRQVGFVPADQFLVIMQRALASPAPTNDAAGGATTNSLARDIPPGLLNPF
jgi:thiol:disulfide interchange protein DsbD